MVNALNTVKIIRGLLPTLAKCKGAAHLRPAQPDYAY